MENNDMLSKNDIAQLYKALCSVGAFLPKTDEEIESAKQEFDRLQLPLSEFPDVKSLLAKPPIQLAGLEKSHQPEEHGMAIAAREGEGEISEDVWKQMQLDKEKARAREDHADVN